MAFGKGMKILLINDNVHADFCGRIRAITNPSFTVGRLN